jgi:hypothetical protein
MDETVEKRRRGRPRKLIQRESEPLLDHPGTDTPGHPAADPMPLLVDILDRIEQRQSEPQHRPFENVPHAEKGAFSFPEGDRAARDAGKVKTFHRQIFFNGHKEELDALTPYEVDIYNEFSRTLPGPLSRRLARDGQWTAVVRANNAELDIFLPCRTQDQQDNLPQTLVYFLREFMDGSEATDPNMLLRNSERLRELEAKFAALAAAGQPVIATG